MYRQLVRLAATVVVVIGWCTPSAAQVEEFGNGLEGGLDDIRYRTILVLQDGVSADVTETEMREKLVDRIKAAGWDAQSEYSEVTFLPRLTLSVKFSDFAISMNLSYSKLVSYGDAAGNEYMARGTFWRKGFTIPNNGEMNILDGIAILTDQFMSDYAEVN